MEESFVILVIEAAPPIQVVVEDALTEGGFEPAVAPSGEEAVTLLKGNKSKYRALVSQTRHSHMLGLNSVITTTNTTERPPFYQWRYGARCGLVLSSPNP